VIQEIFICYQKKVVRKSLYQKAIDFREQRAAYDCVSVEGNRHTDTNYNDDTYGLGMPFLHYCIVEVHFSDTSTQSVKDKLKRVILHDLEHGKQEKPRKSDEK
jgi:hypothetical protein